MGKLRIITVVSLTAAAIGLAPTNGTRAAAPGTPDTTIGGPLISGTSAYVAGTYTWTDYAYDDRGANTDTTDPGGDQVYPAERNVADLIQLQVTPKGEDLHVTAVLETVLDSHTPTVTVGVDLDGKPAPGLTLPGLANSTTLGLDVVERSDHTDVDVTNNTIDLVVPNAATAEQVRMAAVVGTANTTFDLAFVKDWDVCDTEKNTCRHNPDNQLGQDHRQADILAGTNEQPATDALGTIDITKLRRRTTETPRIEQAGYYYLLYHSPLALGEGIRERGAGMRARALPHDLYAGAWQPYVIRVPRTLTAPMPTIVYLHGRSGNHMQGFVNNFMSFDPDAIVVGVLGRGPAVGYGGVDWSGFIEPDGAYGEQDVLDVIGDMKRRNLIDEDHLVIGGISMGGVGSFHLAELHPHLFAGVLPIVGGDAGILPVNWGPGLIENLSNMPLRMANGVLDPLAHVGSQLTPALLHQLKTVDFKAWEALRRHHEWQAGLIDCVWNELIATPRVADPARVIYSINPAFEVTDESTHLVRRHAEAYWVSDLEARPDPAPRSVTSPPSARIDVTSLNRADRTPDPEFVRDVEHNFNLPGHGGRDYCGPSELRSNDAWEVNGLLMRPGPAQPTNNGMDLTILGLTTATLDLPRMQLATSESLTINATGDGPTRLALVGPWPAEVEVSRDGGDPETLRPADGALVLDEDFTGQHTYVLTPTT